MSGLMEFPGVVEWSGENPLMSLKTTSEGPFVTLASFFRVVLSPHGRGHVLVLLQSPHDASPPFERANYCFADNLGLATFLIDGYLSHFAAYKGLAAMTNLQFLPIDEAASAGDPRKSYAEIISSRGMRIELKWAALGEPFSLVFSPEKSATGKHYMPTVIIGSGDASVTIDGRRLPGKPVPREFAGRSITTAMLAFSETWIRA
jgi:hypothetical protein